MRQRWVMLVAAWVAAVAAACGTGPSTGVDDEPEVLTHTEPTAVTVKP